jgi:hypothetical protein
MRSASNPAGGSAIIRSSFVATGRSSSTRWVPPCSAAGATAAAATATTCAPRSLSKFAGRFSFSVSEYEGAPRVLLPPPRNHRLSSWSGFLTSPQTSRSAFFLASSSCPSASAFASASATEPPSASSATTRQVRRTSRPRWFKKTSRTRFVCRPSVSPAKLLIRIVKWVPGAAADHNSCQWHFSSRAKAGGGMIPVTIAAT